MQKNILKTLKNLNSFKIQNFQNYKFSNVLLNGNSHQVPIKSITEVSPDTKIFHLQLDQDQQLGIKTFQHVQIFENIEGETVKRVYTPISPPSQSGQADILIKIYRKNEQYPEGGRLTSTLDNLQPGDKMNIAGPVGKYLYQGNGQIFWPKANLTKKYNKLSMIAGGSGITPIYQIIQHIDIHNEDIQVNAIIANKTQNDILLKEQLKEISSRKPNINIKFTVDVDGNDQEGIRTGLVTKDFIQEFLFESGPETGAIICGPQPMNRSVLSSLEELGYDIENIWKF